MPIGRYLLVAILIAVVGIGLIQIQDRAAEKIDSRMPVFDARTFGAVGDGKTRDTAAIQQAIDHCGSNGGVVDLHDGTFLSGMIRLHSGVELRLEPSATLKGTQNDSDYPDVSLPTNNSQLRNCRKALIFAEATDRITIDGGGTIDGSGDNPNWKGKEFTRPMAIFIGMSKNLAVHDITVKNAGMWGIVSFETDYVTMRNITVNSPYGPTRDGIDIVDGHHVLIEHCRILSEDDAICLKTGTDRGVFDVTVRDCQVIRSGVANGLKLGSASTGFFKKILFDNIEIDNVDKAAMAVESVDGADISDVRFHKIRFKDAGSAIFVILGQRGTLDKMGSIENVSFDDVTGTTKRTWGSAISGCIVSGKTYPLKHLNFNKVRITNTAAAKTVPAEPPEYEGQYPDPNLWSDLPAAGYFLRHIDGITFTDCTTTNAAGDPRPATVKSDVKGFKGSL